MTPRRTLLLLQSVGLARAAVLLTVIPPKASQGIQRMKINVLGVRIAIICTREVAHRWAGAEERSNSISILDYIQIRLGIGSPERIYFLLTHGPHRERSTSLWDMTWDIFRAISTAQNLWGIFMKNSLVEAFDIGILSPQPFSGKYSHLPGTKQFFRLHWTPALGGSRSGAGTVWKNELS